MGEREVNFEHSLRWAERKLGEIAETGETNEHYYICPKERFLDEMELGIQTMLQITRVADALEGIQSILSEKMS